MAEKNNTSRKAAVEGTFYLLMKQSACCARANWMAAMLVLQAMQLFAQNTQAVETPAMYYGDTTRIGRPYSKDPYVIKFKGSYLMYYSIPPYKNSNNAVKGWGIGIAASKDLTAWERTGEITPAGDYEKNGLCAPSLLVMGDTVHIFYQTYGNGRQDAVCHAVSVDGYNFTRDPGNPVFRPAGDWTCGRAIDAEVIRFNNQYLLYFATRDTSFSIQYQGVAGASLNTSFSRDQWKQLTNYTILQPELAWEGKCVEAASVIQRGKKLIMFYAGAYNNAPQQIGVAESKDGIAWHRLSNKPFLANGAVGSWNQSESGHPHIFTDDDGETYLFFQGNNDNGQTWYISKRKVKWKKGRPYLEQ